MKVGKFVTQKFLSAEKDGKDIDGKSVIIDAAYPETINEQEKLCVRFKGLDKPLVLNQTNLNVLMMAYGEDTDMWVNNKVQLIIANVMFNGVAREGIQIKIGK